MVGVIPLLHRTHRPTLRYLPLIATIPVLTTSIAVTGCEEARNEFAAPPPPKVTAIHPEMRQFEPYRDIVATVEPLEIVEVRARISGFLQSRDFDPGDKVETGETLFRLESDEYDANLAIPHTKRRMRSAKRRTREPGVFLESTKCEKSHWTTNSNQPSFRNHNRLAYPTTVSIPIYMNESGTFL